MRLALLLLAAPAWATPLVPTCRTYDAAKQETGDCPYSMFGSAMYVTLGYNSGPGWFIITLGNNYSILNAADSGAAFARMSFDTGTVTYQKTLVVSGPAGQVQVRWGPTADSVDYINGSIHGYGTPLVNLMVPVPPAWTTQTVGTPFTLSISGRITILTLSRAGSSSGRIWFTVPEGTCRFCPPDTRWRKSSKCPSPARWR